MMGSVTSANGDPEPSQPSSAAMVWPQPSQAPIGPTGLAGKIESSSIQGHR